MTDNVLNARQRVINEIADIPDEFIPFIFTQVKTLKESIIKKNNIKKSPTGRLLKLSGTLENPKGLSVKRYKETVADEYLSRR